MITLQYYPFRSYGGADFMKRDIFLLFNNQLFEPDILNQLGCSRVFLAEDRKLIASEKQHKLKLYLNLCSVREYKEELQDAGVKVDHISIENRNDNLEFEKFFLSYLNTENLSKVILFEIEDKYLEKRLTTSFEQNNISYEIKSSPMFLFTRDDFRQLYGDAKSFRMGNFYKVGRKKFNFLIDDNGDPIGGKWSYDEENRKKIPNGTFIPELKKFPQSKYHQEVLSIIERFFANHNGSMDKIWFPVRRESVLELLDDFLLNRLENFGVYEDAMLKGENFLFHSCISAFLNNGLITPQILVHRVLDLFNEKKVPLNSVEGFIRQILGWREFIRGIYQLRGSEQRNSNYWGHKKRLTESWYTGTTGIVPLDDCIQTAIKDGYSHHIPRLMVISNLMNLCEIHPEDIYKWFMEMYIDAYEWVMVPNVFGMATYADGGLMSTKPYTCSSNYILKMSNYSKGDWCDVVDGLYWRFVEKNKSFYASNMRLSFQVKTLARMSEDRKSKIFTKAESFLKTHTRN